MSQKKWAYVLNLEISKNILQVSGLDWVGSTDLGKGISIFEFDDSKGKLKSTGKVVEQYSPTWLEVFPAQNNQTKSNSERSHSALKMLE